MSKNKKVTAIAVFALATLIITIAGLSGPVRSQNNGDAAQAWVHRCTQDEQSGKENCQIVQRLSQTESGKRVVEVIISDATGEQGKRRAVIVLPLGVAIQPGVRLEIDEHEPYSFNISHCLPNGCYAVLDLPTDLTDKLKRGNEAKLTMATFQGKTVSMTLTLKGFTSAFNKL